MMDSTLFSPISFITDIGLSAPPAASNCSGLCFFLYYRQQQQNNENDCLAFLVSFYGCCTKIIKLTNFLLFPINIAS